VYVDGQFTGLIDDFDGTTQRLRVEAGRHQLQIYLDGYHPYTENVMFTRGSTVNLAGKLEPLRPGEAAEPPPAPAPIVRPPDANEGSTLAPAQRASEPAGFGTLSVRVIPADAVILVDGQAWERPRGEDRFSIDLSGGPHQVEVRKEGFRSYVRTVDILGGRAFTLNVSLTPGGSGELRVGR